MHSRDRYPMNATDQEFLAMSPHETNVSLRRIQGMIFTIRGLPVMIDRDLADVYGVENKRLNEQVKRNIERFPDTFRFQLTDAERDELVANCDRFAPLKHATSNPYAFTERSETSPACARSLSRSLPASGLSHWNLKDLGKKWFAFSKFETGAIDMLKRLRGKP